jgi:hypothetical protein
MLGYVLRKRSILKKGNNREIISRVQADDWDGEEFARRLLKWFKE